MVAKTPGVKDSEYHESLLLSIIFLYNRFTSLYIRRYLGVQFEYTSVGPTTAHSTRGKPAIENMKLHTFVVRKNSPLSSAIEKGSCIRWAIHTLIWHFNCRNLTPRCLWNSLTNREKEKSYLEEVVMSRFLLFQSSAPLSAAGVSGRRLENRDVPIRNDKDTLPSPFLLSYIHLLCQPLRSRSGLVFESLHMTALPRSDGDR